MQIVISVCRDDVESKGGCTSTGTCICRLLLVVVSLLLSHEMKQYTSTTTDTTGSSVVQECAYSTRVVGGGPHQKDQPGQVTKTSLLNSTRNISLY
jgi:hypothetical protein